MEDELFLDATDLLCPLPVLRARKKLMDLAPGSLLRVRATDPMARIDIPHFCSEAGHELVAIHEGEKTMEFVIRRGEANYPS